MPIIYTPACTLSSPLIHNLLREVATYQQGGHDAVSPEPEAHLLAGRRCAAPRPGLRAMQSRFVPARRGDRRRDGCGAGLDEQRPPVRPLLPGWDVRLMGY